MSYSLVQLIPRLAEVRDGSVRLRAELVRLRDLFPDAADTFNAQIAEIDSQLAVLDLVMDPAALAALGITVVKELSNPSQYTKDPKRHPGDLTGG